MARSKNAIGWECHEGNTSVRGGHFDSDECAVRVWMQSIDETTARQHRTMQEQDSIDKQNSEDSYLAIYTQTDLKTLQRCGAQIAVNEYERHTEHRQFGRVAKTGATATSLSTVARTQ